MIPPNEGVVRINGFVIDARSVRSNTRFVGEDSGVLMTWFEVDGRFPPERGTLLVSAEGEAESESGSPIPLEVGSAGRFHLAMPLSSSATRIKFTAVLSDGAIETETWRLMFPKAKSQVKAGGSKRLFFSPGLGYTSLSYQQTGVSKFEEKALTGRLAATYLVVPPRWDLSASVFFTAIPLSSTGEKVRFLGVNARAGYAVPSVREPWRLTVAGGLYYTTMIVPGNAFGFSNMSGPQLYPVLRRAFQNQITVSVYVKFSPVIDRIGLGNPANSREVAAGGSVTLPALGAGTAGKSGASGQEHRTTFAVTWDYAWLKVGSALVSSDTKSFTLGLAAGF